MTCSIELRFEQSMSLSPSLAFRSLIYSHQPKNLSDIFALQKEVEIDIMARQLQFSVMA